jgi:hypothetical protein
MEVLIFKTNIRYKKEINSIRRFIGGEPNIIKWNVDLQDIDKVLRIEASDIHPSTIQKLINEAGHYCEELPD